jgi:phage major head subunit gpT-like protein
MAMVTAPVLLALRTAVSLAYNDGFKAVAVNYPKVASTIQSTSKSNTYGWLGEMPEMREWIGGRVIKDMAEQGYVIENKQFESSLGVKRIDIEDDNIGTYNMLYSQLGRTVANFPEKLVFGIFKDGFTTHCYDGKPFFSDTHPVYKNTDGAGADGNGEFDEVSNLLVDPSYTGEPWYLLDTSQVIKPIIYQLRKAPEFVSMTKSDDESVFMRGEYRYGVDTRCNVGFGFWQMAYAVKAPLTTENLKKARAAMQAFKADGGRPLGITPELLVVPTSLQDAAEKLLNREMTTEIVTVQTGVDGNGDPVFAQQSVSVSNDTKGMFELLVSKYL